MNSSLLEIRSYIEGHEDTIMQDWFDLIRIPGVSETGEHIEECCDWLIEKMRSMGIEVRKLSVKPYPAIEGRLGNDPKKKTVLLYAHYDVKPAGKLELWNTPPFEPTVIDGKVYARGSADNKAPLMAHLKAVDYYLKTGTELPVNLILLFEGCEEDGSRGLAEFLAENRENYQADLVFFSDGSKDPANLPIIALGCKGLQGIEIRVNTMRTNAHSRYAPVLPNAMWVLVDLLSKLKTGDRVNVPGFYDDILPIGEKEKAILDATPSSTKQMEELYQTKINCYGLSFHDRLNNAPTFNINQIEGGANGVVPSQAIAKLDMRLVAGMHPEETFLKVEKYIRELGYGDEVEVINTGGVEPSKTDISTQYLPIIEQATQEVYGEYVVYPCRPSTAPDFIWTRVLGIPAIQVRNSDADSDNHAPNEKESIKEYMDGIAVTARVLQLIGDMK